MPSIPIPEDAATRRMVVVAVANQKGGVGKTTMAALLAQEAAARGLRAMAIDLDPQGNLTRHLHPAPVRTGVARMLYEKAALESVLCDAGGVSLAAATPDLSAADLALSSKPGRDGLLRRALGPCAHAYDLAVIDTPPGLGCLAFNALVAADFVLIPTAAEKFAFDETAEVVDTVGQVRECANTCLSVLGVVVTRWQGRTIVQQDFDEALRRWAEAKGVPVIGRVRQSVVVQEAQALGAHLPDYKPDSPAAADALAVADAAFRLLGLADRKGASDGAA